MPTALKFTFPLDQATRASDEMPVTITEKWLQEIGGWKAMKAARRLADSGLIAHAEFTSKGEWQGLVSGTVSSGTKPIACGLAIKSRTDVTNLCTCYTSRREGQICEHSLAAALVSLRPTAPAAIPAAIQKSSALPKSWHIEIPSSLPAHWQKKRIPVKATLLAEGIPNAPLTQWLTEHKAFPSSGNTALLSLTPTQATELLSSLTEIQENGDTLSIGDMPLRLPLTADLSADDEVTLTLPPFPKDTHILDTWLYLGKSRSLVPLPTTGIDVPPSLSIADFLKNLPFLESAFQLRSGNSGLLEKITVRPGQARFSISLEGSLNHLAAQVRCDYLDSTGQVLTETGSGQLMPDPADSLRFYSRDLDTENIAMQQLRDADFAGPDKGGQFILRGENDILAFYAADLPRMQRDPLWDVKIGERFTHVTRNVQRVKPTLTPAQSSGEDWFAFELHYQTDGGEDISPADITRLLQTGQSGIKRPNGSRIAVDTSMIEDLQETLLDIHPDQTRPGQYKIASSQTPYLEQSIATWSGDKETKKDLSPIQLGELDDILRDYQKEGAQWIYNHMQSGHGVILADEMGLGKTLQTLAVISSTKAAANKDERKPSIVVCPASLLYNWLQEAVRFVPHLKAEILHGSDRAQLLQQSSQTDIYITSYALLVRDAHVLSTIDFDIAVLDEASAIRNPSTQSAKAAVALSRRTAGRIALTGTPVENSVRDLWSIMHFAMPGYMGTAEEFRLRYEQPIQQSPDTSKPQQDRLRRRLAPYLLRRTKRVVAKELPDKIETVRLCDLTSAQGEVYRQFLDKSRAQTQDLLRTQGFQKARMQILSTLLRLRQICCDLRLLDGFDQRAPEESGKLNAFNEIIDESIEGGHRVLVFSQFVSMLTLLKKACDTRDTAYAYIDGSTSPKARAAQVDLFQKERKTPLFLISLKAGGYGLNLTAADTVIHYDPWWNPAVEAQATDRAHRIGQQNIVTAHKLIARGTIEERILSLQKRKKNIIDAALDDTTPMMRGLAQSDIEEIMEL